MNAAAATIVASVLLLGLLGDTQDRHLRLRLGLRQRDPARTLACRGRVHRVAVGAGLRVPQEVVDGPLDTRRDRALEPHRLLVRLGPAEPDDACEQPLHERVPIATGLLAVDAQVADVRAAEVVEPVALERLERCGGNRLGARDRHRLGQGSVGRYGGLLRQGGTGADGKRGDEGAQSTGHAELRKRRRRDAIRASSRLRRTNVRCSAPTNVGSSG